MTQMDELIARVEAATGPDRELDAAIWRSSCPNAYAIWEGRTRGLLSRDWDEDRRQVTLRARAIAAAPAYTASIDAAMTLIGDDCWKVEDHPVAGPFAVVGEQEGYAATPALALCAAALRSRQEKQDG